MKLDFSKLKKNTENQQPTNTPQVDPTTQTGIKLSFTEGKTYDLDEIIANKLRDNENGTLVLRTIGDIQFRNRMIELVTKKILDDYGVEWTEDNWKLAETLAKVNNFSRVFDAYFTRYYEEYKKVINSGNFEGSFSIDTILRTIKLTKEDIRKYTLTDVCEHQTEFLNYSDRNRPLIIWTDGTNDCGCGDNGKSYDKLANDIKTTKELANNTKENLETNYYNKTETEKKIQDDTSKSFYNKKEIDTKLSNFSENVYTKTNADSIFATKTELETEKVQTIVKLINLADLSSNIIKFVEPLTEEEYEKLKNNKIELKLVYIEAGTGINGSIIFKSTPYTLNIAGSVRYTSVVSTVNTTIIFNVLFGTLTINSTDLSKIVYTPYVDVNPKYDERLEGQEILKAINYNGVPALNHSYRVCRMKYDTDSKFFITDSTMVDFIYSENGYGIGESFETRLGLVNKKSYSVFSGLNSIGTGIIYDTETHKVIYVTIEYIRDTSVEYKIKMELHAYQDGEDITDAFISTKLFNASEGGEIEIYAL